MPKYYSASQFYKEKFGCKVYKISLDANCTCPNRDGSKGFGGCVFCSPMGSGEFCADKKMSIKNQVIEAKKIVEKKIKGERKFIAYFQNFSNTYGDENILYKKFLEAINQPEICGISIATRPDCISEKMLFYLKNLSEKTFVMIELGLQTSNEKTGKKINRCFLNEDFLDAVNRIKKNAPEIHIVTHIIFGLYDETLTDMLNSVKFTLDCKIHGLKFTCLYILKGTKLENDYKNGLVFPLSEDEYFEILSKALEIIPKNIVIHRLTGDGPKKLLIEPEWTKNKKEVINRINSVF